MYNSCRNRHCPQCQSFDQARWLEARIERILPVPYFHVVFTLPSELRAIARYNPAAVYSLLARLGAATLLEVAATPRHLGAQPAITTVLHTWSRDLSYHVHLHCIVSAGGLSADGASWIRSRRADYLFPIRVLGALFRGKMMNALDRGLRDGTLRLPDDAADMFTRVRDRLHRTRWLVYAKKPFAGAEQVYAYLGRYTHRVGISNHRIESLDAEGRVTFRTKNGDHCTLAAADFLGRFVQHVLPRGFVKIRHYGLYAAGNVQTRLAVARALIEPRRKDARVTAPPSPGTWPEMLVALCDVDVGVCTRCGCQAVVRRPLHEPSASWPVTPDTS